MQVPTMLRLTSSTMTQLAVKRCLTTKLVLHPLAMTARLIPSFKMLIWLMNQVWRSLLPVLNILLALLLLCLTHTQKSSS